MTAPKTSQNGLYLASSGNGTANGSWSPITSLQTVPVSSTTPTSGQVLEYDGTSWTPTTPSPTGFDAGRIFSTTTTSVSDSTFTQITLDSGSGTGYYINGAMTRITNGLQSGTSGVYAISGAASMTPSATASDIRLAIYIGGTISFLSRTHTATTAQYNWVVNGDFYVASGTAITLWLYQTTGATQTVLGGAANTWLSAHLVSI